MLIAIDGLDGSGKETQSRLLLENLVSAGKNAKTISFPTYDKIGSAFVNFYLGGGFGENPADTGAYAASTFYAMDRYYSFRTDWEADYKSGKTVIANRYTTANAVHQLSKLPREKWDEFLDWLWDFEFNKLGLPEPELVIYLEMPPRLSMRLIDERSARTGTVKDIHERDLHYLEKSYEAAMYVSEKLGWKRIRCYGGTDEEQYFRTREDIAAEVLSCVGDKI